MNESGTLLRQRVATGGLLLAALIHLPPLAGLGGAAALSRLYGIGLPDPQLTLLLQHRALTFGLLSALLFGAIRWPHWRTPAIACVLASDLGFVLLVSAHWPVNDALLRIAGFDLLSILALVVAAVAGRRPAS